MSAQKSLRSLKPPHFKACDLKILFSSALCCLDIVFAVLLLPKTAPKIEFSCRYGQRSTIFTCPPLRCLWRRQSSSNLSEGLIFFLACSVHFVRRRFSGISTESQRSRPNRWWTKCTEHARKKIRPSERLEPCILLRVHHP